VPAQNTGGLYEVNFTARRVRSGRYGPSIFGTETGSLFLPDSPSQNGKLLESLPIFSAIFCPRILFIDQL
jgi:hypothetical protein